MTVTLYLSGPMTGHDNLNFEKFHSLAESLRNDGYVVLNPAETAGGYKKMNEEWYLEHDLHMITMCDRVAVMDGWEHSEGAQLEAHVAQKLNKPVVRADNPKKQITLGVEITPEGEKKLES